MTSLGYIHGRKDICDRKTAPMKSHIRRWVNEKNDVLTALGMKTALESHGGLKGCRLAVVKIDPVAENASQPNKIPGISLLNNFAFTKNGIRVWCAFNVGLGKVLLYKDLNVQTQQDTKLAVIYDFGPKHQTGSISSSQVQRTEYFLAMKSPAFLLSSLLKRLRPTWTLANTSTQVNMNLCMTQPKRCAQKELQK